MTSTFMKLREKGNLSGAGTWAGLGMGETNSERKVNRIRRENTHRSGKTIG